MSKKVLFIDRDGTLINEPLDNFQIDRIEKLVLEPYVINALLILQQANFQLVMVSNQDGLGTSSFPQEDFDRPHNLMMQIFKSQNIFFDQVLICPHLAKDKCHCRKPGIALVAPWLVGNKIDRTKSYVIGDRETDIKLAYNMGINSLRYNRNTMNWQAICNYLTSLNRYAHVKRITKETSINVEVWLDREAPSKINTGINFFDHMLEQIATHSGLCMTIEVKGDLYIDDHHTIEDTAIALGTALKQGLGDKHGINRFGFLLPMDECLARCVIDLSGRPFLEYTAEYSYQKVGDMSTEMVEHFFRSLSYAMACTLYLKTEGKNDHHRVESLFKVFGRALRQAICVESNVLPSSKGVLS
ncbi:bifunctional histidinol-phosphatase/imidazoleglycerol-phosphate dehydratase HisB [Candidatus Palibaumannia cicadellinicola]|uniref:Histidine biosynthesis bifunctional protein HisB n=1 Tax=Baumannia cicadellinicola subsp. Homalodisca coagulata TaxID=374463 RepID=HIS7_BAUCH|nr:bifunctional histidinol-phosphatase/imidazoleglycerol-phosphate dehydratase HisB [Candidatus Baumannia cicadellinicola]Q1LT69.1 RecName: Full=Histidine biosynthesis bifunctional protein HisB; Includes: RecName: Full=Histidinol-phosphatase; Includes: RecName: Full=Imidazoleglycerol-phosphate dehydratase; Short=IGPD [Baumannia cicadellinicola str. Hc (Homalodisca coagulata)]ABF13797.1 histidinol-phosphatase/imidazoleglycerol-phosphate dehydratase [Baumannia cicadellinicola str. Hc (Homalodisca c